MAAPTSRPPPSSRGANDAESVVRQQHRTISVPAHDVGSRRSRGDVFISYMLLVAISFAVAVIGHGVGVGMSMGSYYDVSFAVPGGGGWDGNAFYCRASNRDNDAPGFRNGIIGCRFARTAD